MSRHARLLGSLAGFLPFLLALCLGWYMAPRGTVAGWETLWLDKLQLARLSLQPARENPRVLLVGVDSETLQYLNKPAVFWLPDFAELATALLEAGATAVAFDYIFPAASGNLSPAVAEQLANDRISMLTVLLGGKVALGYLPDSEQERGEHNHPELESTATQFRSLVALTLVADSDGIYRSTYPLIGSEQASMALWLAEKLGHKVQWDGRTLKVGERVVPLEGPPSQPRLRASYRRPLPSHVSAARLLQQSRRGEALTIARDKVCVIAPWLISTDFRPSVYDGLASVRNRGGTQGVQHHLAALQTMLEGTAIVPYSPLLGSLMSLTLCALMMAVGYRARRHALLAALILCLHTLVNGLAFCLGNVWLPFWPPLLGGLLGYAGGYEWRYLTVERQRRLTHDLFSRMVAPQVVEQVLSDARQRQLGGISRRVTVLYTDINDFTPMCERHTPAEVIVMLNRYFEEMVSLIFRHEGMLKQFVGDEIMVIYGAPMEQPDHAARAVLTALDMLARLRQLEAEAAGEDGFFDIKVGINTGDVVVGHVGSEKHMEYAAVGDDVNLGARIMATTKKLGVSILVSETTKREAEPYLGTRVEWISHGVQTFKGKTAQVEVYEVRRKSEG